MKNHTSSSQGFSEESLFEANPNFSQNGNRPIGPKGIPLKTFFFFILLIFIGRNAQAQVTEFFIDNWYLHTLSVNNQVYDVASLPITQNPTMIIEADYTLHGFGFCNEYSGEYNYWVHAPLGVDDTFQPINVTFGNDPCTGDLQVLEDGFFVMFAEEKVSDVYVISPPGTNPKHIVLQHPGGYHEYKNFPALKTPEFGDFDFSLFPNPTSDRLFINTSEKLLSVVITDVQGKKVKTGQYETSPEIDVSELKAGMYFITLTAAEGRVTKKFIKK